LLSKWRLVTRLLGRGLLAAFSTAPGFDASSWLLGEVMAWFFALA
jgi:hypothetical protein